MHMLFEEWNRRASNQVLSVLGAPSQEGRGRQDWAIDDPQIYTWGTLRSTTLRLRLSGDGRRSEMRQGNG
jgi:hypothetical protein